MPERTKYAPGTPSWVDIQTSDPTGAKAFYSALFGWEYDDQPVGHDAEGNDAFYSMATKNGKHVAAIAPLPMPGVPPHWNTYVTVADVDATAAQVPGAGGSVMMPPFDVMDAGRMAVIADPTGALICLWQATNHIGASLVNEHGTLVVGRGDDTRRSGRDRLLRQDLRVGGGAGRHAAAWSTPSSSSMVGVSAAR